MLSHFQFWSLKRRPLLLKANNLSVCLTPDYIESGSTPCVLNIKRYLRGVVINI